MIKNAKVVGEFNFSNAKKLIIAAVIVAIWIWAIILASIIMIKNR